jgi:threonine synthase
VRVLEATGGTVEQVSETELAIAKAEIGADGIGCEPASAVTLAGLKKLAAQGFVGPEEQIVLILTGNILKDQDFTIKFHRGDLFKETEQIRTHRRPPVVLDANVDGVLKALEQHERAS